MRRFARILFIAIGVLFVIAVACSFMGGYWTDPRWIYVIITSSWMSTVYALAAFVCARAISIGKGSRWSTSGIVASAGAVTLWPFVAWHSGAHQEIPLWILALSVVVGGWSGLMAFAALLSQIAVRGRLGHRLRVVTLMFAVVLYAASLFVLAGPPVARMVHADSRQSVRKVSQAGTRTFAIVSIATGVSLFLTLLASRMHTINSEEIPEEIRLRFTAMCPRCHSTHAMRTHGDHCGVCGFEIRVTPT